MSIKTNWYIITGGPSSGKTKTLEYLSFLGHQTIPEAARILIDLKLSRGETIQDIRKDEAKFQKDILKMKVQVENRLPPENLIFFDRGIPDSLAYFQFYNLDINDVLKVCKRRKYKGVFLLEQLPYESDYARVEDEKAAQKLNDLLYHSYVDLGYNVTKILLKPIDGRVKDIIEAIKALPEVST